MEIGVLNMPINFHDEQNRYTYASREADETWTNVIRHMTEVKGKKVLDIGCGGGIYSKKLADMGASHVTGIDFSEQSLIGARDYCKAYENIDFQQGNALQIDLADEQFDIVLERAVVHHFDDLTSNFSEIHRVLRDDGSVIIQDRTPEDCFLPGSATHLRGYFFDRFPKLKEQEQNRRHSSDRVIAELQKAGFQYIMEVSLWETRKIYNDKQALYDDLLARTGRSILHELSDDELKELSDYIIESIEPSNDKIIEQDRWTIWTAKK
jgi:ubiquinone/menaquinone biosynthesis C-methylase UbiE